MNIKRISGITIAVIGICAYLFGSYIEAQVNDGKGQISSGQKKVDTIRDVGGLSPYTQDLGDSVASSGQKKIDEGQKLVDKYEELAEELHLGGVLLFLIGAGLTGWSFVQKKR